MSDFYEKQVETKTVLDGMIVTVRQDIVLLKNGNKAGREVVVHPGGVGIVAVTDDKKILIVNQYRYPMEEDVAEIPAGKLESGEDPFECAVRELSEETGYSAGRYIDLGTIYPSPGYCREILYLYLALDLKPGEMHLDDNELLRVEEVDIDVLADKVMAGEIKDAKTVVGILKAVRYLESSVYLESNRAHEKKEQTER